MTLRSKHMPSTRLGRAMGTAGLTLRLGAHFGSGAAKSLASLQKPTLHNTLLTPQAAHSLAHSLKSMRGAAMKLGQLLSLDESILLPPDFAQALATLRESGYAMTPKQLRQRLDAAWGTGWIKQFQSFDTTPFAAASIGQVHRATLSSGEQVAIKVQFPNVRASIDSDLRNLAMLMRHSRLIPPELDLDHYLGICRDQLMAETDYTQEARAMQRMGDLAQGSGVHIPQVHAPLSCESVLVMSYARGISLDHAAKSDHALATQIGRDLIDLLTREIFDWRYVQTDPNLANFKYDDQRGQLVLLDFGSCSAVTTRSWLIYKNLLTHAVENDFAGIKTVLAEEKLLPRDCPSALAEFIDKAIKTALADLHTGGGFDFRHAAVFDIIQSREFQNIQMSIPEEPVSGDFLFIQRKIVGLLLTCRSWGITLPLRDMLRDLDARLRPNG